MPLADRTIQPRWLGRRPLSDEEKTEDVVLTAVSHNAILGAVIQLASLVRHADDIFCDLAEECQNVFEKTESIANKIHNVERIIKQLDSTEVTIPVGTLSQFSKVTDHHVAKHGFDCDHFTSSNRPHCVKFNYSMCEVTPVHALHGADMYRKDGLCSSHLFKLWPIALKDTPVRTDEMNIPNRLSSVAYRKRYKILKLRERPKTIHSIDEIFHESEKSSGDLQASKTDSLSRSQPSFVIPVDTSGASFERMASFRQSARDQEAGRVRKRRRRTVSGVPDNIMQEIEQFESGRRIQRNGPRKYSLDDLDQKDIDTRDEVMQQYLLEIDAAIAEREEEEYAEQKEAKLLKFLPCRRSRSLPRCVKIISGSRNKDGMTRSSLYLKKQPKVPADELTPRQPADGLHSKFSSSVSLRSQGASGHENRLSRSAKRASLIGDKLKSLVSGTLKPRPKSLDFDSIEVKDEEKKAVNKRASRAKSMDRLSSLSRVNSPSMPEGIMTRATSTESQVGPGSYYYFDNNTLPRAQAKKYDFPWDSLPKDWTTSVKLREISKRRKEDRQSSSGNWSQSGYSSNRQSMDSDVKSSMPSTTSQYSLGKDSGRDSPRSAGDRDGLDTGYMGDAPSTESVSDTKSMSNTDSDEWLRSLAERAASRGDVTSTSAEALANLSRLTKQNIRNLDILVPGRSNLRRKRNELEDDGESSVYSLDQEGFYTSFHNDSGLRKSTNTLGNDEDEDLMMPIIRESKSLQSVASFNTIDSVILKPQDKNHLDSPTSSSSVSSPNLPSLSLNIKPQFENFDSDIPDIDAPEEGGYDVEYGDTGTLKAKKDKKKKPPPPPPRTSSIIKSNGVHENGETSNKPSDSPNNNETSSESSDQETVHKRLKMKTSISAHTFPSWCPGIVSDEDDLVIKDPLSASQERLHAESSEVEEMFSSEKENWLSGTLPRTMVNPMSTNSPADPDYTTRSWPRSKHFKYQQGILKTPEKDKAKSGNMKTLNFAPVVNLFDAQSPHGVQMPLSRMSSSDESSSPPGTSSFSSHPANLKMSNPMVKDQQKLFKGELTSGKQEMKGQKDVPSEYQPKFSVTPGSKLSRPQSMVLYPRELMTASSTPIVNHHSTITSFATVHCSDSDNNRESQSSNLSSINSSSTPSIASFDSFDIPPMTPLNAHDKSTDTLSSNSTIALSDIDSSSLTHVTIDDFTSSHSTLSLFWDTDETPNPTPKTTPVRKRASENNLQTSNEKLHDNKVNDNQARNNKDLSLSETHNPHSNVPSSSHLSSLSSNQGLNNLSKTQPMLTSHSGVGLSEKGPVFSAQNLPSSSLSSIKSTTSSSAPNANFYKQSNLMLSDSGAPQHNTKDSNNNKNKASYFTFPESTIPKSSTWSTNDNMIIQSQNQPTSKPNCPSIPHSQSWSDTPATGNHHQHNETTNPSARYHYSDRRRSSPILNQGHGNSSSSSYSGNESSSGSNRRRRSGNEVHSPADSGFGSPSAPNQPSMSVQPFSQYLPQPLPNSQSLSSQSSFYTKSNVPNIKQSLLDSKPSQFSYKSGSTHANGPYKMDYPHMSQSNESLSSYNSCSSTTQFIQKNSKTDLSQPVLRSGNSSESLHSNSSAGRSDSYRVAMLVDNDEKSLLHKSKTKINNVSANNINKNIGKRSPSSSRAPITKSLSMPSPAYNDDNASRADSYRCAVRNTQSAILNDMMGRNSSYRLATCEEDVVITDNRMDACNLWTGKTGASRDLRRMGITDIDQLKNYGSESDNQRAGSKRGTTKSVDTLHSKKMLGVKPDTQALVTAKNSPAEHRRFMRSNSKDKDKGKQKTQSSTYIRFDPIFESGEDLRASNESLRPPSIVSIRTLAKADSSETLTSGDTTHLTGQRRGSTSPTRKRSGSQGRKSSDEKPVMSLFGSIKTTIKSIGGGKGE